MFHRFHKISSLNPFGSLACVTTIHVVMRFSVIRPALHAIIIYLHNRLDACKGRLYIMRYT